MKVAAEGGEFRAGMPEPLFELPSNLCEAFPDGTFLIARPSLNPDAPTLSVIVNWRP